jgi:UMF1 family MFS transporter
MFGMADAGVASRISFVSVSIWWLLFSIPLFRHVREPAVVARGEQGHPLAIASRRLVQTLKELRGFRQAFLLLVAFAIYNDGINTIIRMASVFGTEIGLPEDSLILSFLVVQFVGVPFAFAFGRLAAHIGAKRSVLLSLVVYTGISVFGYFVSTSWEFFLLAFMVGSVQGGSQALSRSLFAAMIPRHRSSEFFAFFGIFEKFAGILGPVLFAVVADVVGSSRPAIVMVVAFFAVGGYLLTRVDVEAGERAAREAERHVVAEGAASA